MTRDRRLSRRRGKRKVLGEEVDERINRSNRFYRLKRFEKHCSRQHLPRCRRKERQINNPAARQYRGFRQLCRLALKSPGLCKKRNYTELTQTTRCLPEFAETGYSWNLFKNSILLCVSNACYQYRAYRLQDLDFSRYSSAKTCLTSHVSFQFACITHLSIAFMIISCTLL